MSKVADLQTLTGRGGADVWLRVVESGMSSACGGGRRVTRLFQALRHLWPRYHPNLPPGQAKSPEGCSRNPL